MVGREATTFAAQLIDLKTINFRRFVDAATDGPATRLLIDVSDTL
jgi:hypothetical protein